MKNTLPQTWLTVYDVWVAFVRRSPQLAISPSQKALTNFLAIYGKTLVENGALAKTRSRRWLAHRELFPVVAFALWANQDPRQAVADYRAHPNSMPREAAAS